APLHSAARQRCTVRLLGGTDCAVLRCEGLPLNGMSGSLAAKSRNPIGAPFGRKTQWGTGPPEAQDQRGGGSSGSSAGHQQWDGRE
ncbi:unnamed protein product, partial [Polarella glacialis]